MPKSKQRIRTCQWCHKEYELGVDSTQHKYCSTSCRGAWHYNRWKSSGGKRCKKKTHEYWLKHKYGITSEEKERMLVEQNNACAICKTEEPGGYNWHVDHCHETGKVRGILCCNCNQALGLMRESVEAVRSMERYINERCKSGVVNSECREPDGKDGEGIQPTERKQ